MEHRTIKDDYNKSAHQILENRLQAYNLSNDEKAQVWAITGEKENLLAKGKENFEQNKNDLVKKEYDQLRANEKPQPRLTMGNNRPNYNYLVLQAQTNVYKRFDDLQTGIQKNADKQINAILKQSKDREKQQYPDLSRDFQNAHDNNKERDR